MADLLIPEEPDLETDVLAAEIDETVISEVPLWRIRLRLLRRTFSKNWKLFAENKVGVVGLGIIIVFAIMAILQPVLLATRVWPPRVYDPVVGYEDNPATVVQTVVQEVTDPLTEVSLKEALLLTPTAQIGDEITTLMQPAPPTICFGEPEPCNNHFLGTDPLGRDVLSQLMFGARAAFFLGTVAALVTVIIATLVGSISAYYGGALDAIFMRFADLLLMLPFLAILIALSGVFLDIRLWHLAVVIGLLSGFGGTAIILKSQALAVKVKPFIDAARIAGGSDLRIILTHLIPNVLPLSFLYMMFTVTAAIAIEATLSFLGLFNVSMSWGIMIQIAQNQGYLLQGTKFWWLLLPAGLSVTLLAAAFYLVGRGMDEIVNPRLRQR
jgi:peptide/nickel transport system permease protein